MNILQLPFSDKYVHLSVDWYTARTYMQVLVVLQCSIRFSAVKHIATFTIFMIKSQITKFMKIKRYTVITYYYTICALNS